MPSGVGDQREQNQSHRQHPHSQTQPSDLLGFPEMGPSLFSTLFIHQLQGNISDEPPSTIIYFPSLCQASKLQPLPLLIMVHCR